MTVSINGSTGLVFNDGSSQATAATGFGFKNRIINGDMRIDQRNNGASISTSGFAVDRFEFQENGAAAFTVQRSTVAPAGFVNSMLVTVTTAGSATAAQVNRFFQRIEGNNIADLGFGTANASTTTLSFWVRSSLTGTYCTALVNNAANRSYVAEYSITAANTWEYKTITIAGDTTGTWETGTSSGVQVTFDLGSGSDYNATAGSWVAANDFRTTNQANFANTLGATFAVTGVDLRKGSTGAYPNGQNDFDYRPYGTELALCQRYFCKTYNQATTPGTSSGTCPIRSTATGNAYGTIGIWNFPVTMRAAPTITGYSPVNGAAGSFSGDSTNYTQLGIHGATEAGVGFFINNNAIGANTFLAVHATAAIEL